MRNIKKTELIVREDNTIFGEYNYVDYLLLMLDIIEGRITEQLYFRNEHGGINKIDSFGCSMYRHYKDISGLLREIVKAQIDKRIKKSNLETKIENIETR